MSYGTTTYVDENTRTFAIETPGNLDGKQDYLVELGAAEDSVKLLVTPGNAIGTVRNILQAGHPQVAIRLLGKDGTLRVVQSAAIAKGALVKAAAGGTVVPAATAGDRVLGRKLSQGNGAVGEIIEIIDALEKV